MTTRAERVELGTVGDKEYVWNCTDNRLEWSVPDPRSAIRAPFGYTILAADYSQIEVKLMAFLSKDPILIEAINSGLDIHSFNATEVFGERYGFTYELMETAREDDRHPRHNELSLIRSRIKTVTFGVPYGAGASRVAFLTGMSEEEAQEFIDAFFKKFKVLKAWLDRQGVLAILEGFSTSIGGRKRFYVLPNERDPEYKKIISQIKRWAGNMPIQASNADILKKAMAMLYKALRGGNVTAKRLYDAWFSLCVHDELVLTVKNEDVPAVKKLMKECMDAAYHFFVPQFGSPGWIALGPEKHDWGVKIVEAQIWAKG